MIPPTWSANSNFSAARDSTELLDDITLAHKGLLSESSVILTLFLKPYDTKISRTGWELTLSTIGSVGKPVLANQCA